MLNQEEIEFERARQLDDKLTTCYLNGCYKTPFDEDINDPHILTYLKYYFVGVEDADQSERQ